jgi:DNA-binding MarR family transcriptional regulator
MPRSADEPATARGEDRDLIDSTIEQWRRERPDLDLSALQIFGRLLLVEQAVAPVVEEVFVRHGISRGEFDVLTSLRRSEPPHRLTPSRLADSLLSSRGGMTKRLDRLEEAGLVRRELDPSDRRSFTITLTPRGTELIDGVMTEHASNLARLTASLTSREATALEPLLRKLLRSAQRSRADLRPKPGD